MVLVALVLGAAGCGTESKVANHTTTTVEAAAPTTPSTTNLALSPSSPISMEQWERGNAAKILGLVNFTKDHPYHLNMDLGLRPATSEVNPLPNSDPMAWCMSLARVASDALSTSPIPDSQLQKAWTTAALDLKRGAQDCVLFGAGRHVDPTWIDLLPKGFQTLAGFEVALRKDVGG